MITDTPGLSALSVCGRLEACAAACAAVDSALCAASSAFPLFASVSCSRRSSCCRRCCSCLSSSRILAVSDSCACAGKAATANAMAHHMLRNIVLSSGYEGSLARRGHIRREREDLEKVEQVEKRLPPAIRRQGKKTPCK